MYRFSCLILLTVLLHTLNAQEQREFQTISRDKIRVSGFGGPMMSFTMIGDDFAHMMGGGGGIIINNFFFGGYGMGKTNEIIYKNETSNLQVMEFGHGGLWGGYTMFYNKAVHPVIHTGVGWGAISKRQKNNENAESTDIDQVFVISPTAELEMNFSRFFKLGGGISYTFVYNTDGPYTFSDFNKPGFFLSFKFGWF